MTAKKLICKDNRIIEASYRLTLIEQHLVLLAISNINSQEKLNGNKLFKITAAQYSSMFGGNIKESFRVIKNAVNQLSERWIKVIDNEGNKREYRWITEKGTILSDQSIEMRFNTELAPYLHGLKGNFTKYRILNISNMSSIYSIRIYEMLMQWKSCKTLKLSLEELKERLQIEGKYHLYGHIKSKIIDHAIMEINDYSDIDVSYQQIKSGKKVVSIVFTFKFKPGMEPKQRTKSIDVIKSLKDACK